MNMFKDDTLFSMTFRYSSIGMALVDMDGKWLKVNPSLCEMTGYQEEEILGMSYREMTPEEDVLKVQTLSEELLAGTRDNFQIEKRYIRKDQQLIFALLTVSIVRNEEKEPLFYISQIQDITEMKRNEERLKLFAIVAENTQHGVMITDKKMKIVYVNKGFTSITGYSFNEALDETPHLIQSGKHDKAFYQEMWRHIEERGYWEGEIWNKHKDGTISPEWLNISPVKEENGNISHYVAVFRNITNLKMIEHKLTKMNEKLSVLSSLDGLTGIPNRRSFDEELQNRWNESLASGTPLSLLMLDIDFFKKYNDTYGHLQGDECLKKVAMCLTETAAGPLNLVARYGGEEFAIVMANTDKVTAFTMAENVNKMIRDLRIPHLQSEVHDYVTVSVGVASILPGESTSPFTLIEKADRALYGAKAKGRDRVETESSLTLSY
jgi:diguanylate cyclase (GGDEF)-like protein/PAS domain S-box-containing protein